MAVTVSQRRRFAGAGLLARPWIKRAYAGGIQDVSQLAQLFAVSEQAMQIRLRQLGISEPYQRCSGMDNTYLRSLPLRPLNLAA